MSFRFRPGARLLIVCALVAGASSSVFGQSTQSQAPIQTPPRPTPSAKGLDPTGPVRQLSIDEAVKLALEQNLGLQIERFNPELQDLNTAQQLSNYVPVFGGGVFTQSQDNPPNSFLSGASDTISTDTPTWTKVESSDLPGSWITRIAIDPEDGNVAYVTYSGYRDGDDAPHVLKTTDAGATWTNISGDLPAALRLENEGAFVDPLAEAHALPARPAARCRPCRGPAACLGTGSGGRRLTAA